jgi:hypothetical protein
MCQFRGELLLPLLLLLLLLLREELGIHEDGWSDVTTNGF